MASLNIPPEGARSLGGKLSNASLRHRMILREDSLGPVGHSRRASSDVIATPPMSPYGTVAPTCTPNTYSPPGPSPGLDIDLDPTHALGCVRHYDASEYEGRLDSAFEVNGANHGHESDNHPTKVVYAGPIPHQKRFELHANTLSAKSRYFHRLFQLDANINYLVFDDADPIAMDMWTRWLDDRPLAPPDSFHSITHWFGLYILSIRFETEELRNTGTRSHLPAHCPPHALSRAS